MFDNEQFRSEIIKKSLRPLDLWQQNAEELLVMTCAQESLGGKYLVQTNGPALGVYQMEPATHADIWENYLRSKVVLFNEIYGMLGSKRYPVRPDDSLLVYNLHYATIMARVFYLRMPETIPAANDVEGLASYYKRFYNTAAGKATIPEVISNYNAFIGQK